MNRRFQGSCSAIFVAVAFLLALYCGDTNFAFAQLPANYQLGQDWLIDNSIFDAEVRLDQEKRHFVLSNGLVRRVISERLGTTIEYSNLMTDQNLIRAIEPEGTVSVDGQEYSIGGVESQPNKAFVTQEWLDEMKPLSGALQLVGHEISAPKPRFPWMQTRHRSPHCVWPPKGKVLRLDYQNASSKARFLLSVHYQIYDGIPLISKWMTVSNVGEKPITVDRFCSERLSVVEHDNPVETREGVQPKKPDSLHVETDMAFGGFNFANANRHAVHWRPDPTYKTQVNYLLKSPALLVVEPSYGPAQTVEPDEKFETFRAFELIRDGGDRERKGLAVRKMYRVIAPWVTENPLMLHCRSAKKEVVMAAIDQAANVGFEMVILSFGSGFDAENESSDHLQHWREMSDYAREKGIHLGGYSLYSSRSAGKGNNIVTPEGMSPTHGRCPAVTSPWGIDYVRKLYKLFERTGFLVLEHDGPYPGDVDVTARPPLQKGMEDSRWVHWRIWTDFYKHLRGQGVYMNLPDYYYLAGSNKCGMGYREVNWSLPREEQRIHTRQNIFDGTWYKTPSMGWMFVPLTQYHGGGAAATIEPLNEHCDHYETMLKSNLGLGVQACYRGPRLYDTEKTRAMVAKTVAWYKKHRDILESDLIHGRRADGKDLDWMLHVNPRLKTKALMSIYNPTMEPITKTIRVPLYYSGLRGSARTQLGEQKAQAVKLDNGQRANVTVTVPANGFEYVLFQ